MLNFDDIFKAYYEKILNFCYAKIGDKQLAEDCTQEVFLAFSKKFHSLKLSTNISAWLYGAAKNEIKRCLRKNRHVRENVPLDDSDAVVQACDQNSGILENILTAEEYHTLEEYYINGEDISRITADNNVSASAMYQRIHRIKQKIIKNYDKFHKFSDE